MQLKYMFTYIRYRGILLAYYVYIVLYKVYLMVSIVTTWPCIYPCSIEALKWIHPGPYNKCADEEDHIHI